MKKYCFFIGFEWGWPTNFFFLVVCHGTPGVIPRNVMASDNSSLEIVRSRGSHFLVHLAPEFRQEKDFYLKALCVVEFPCLFIATFHREWWWPPQMRKPGHSGLALQLPWNSTWPDSSFWGIGILSYISSKSTTLLPYSLAFLLTPAPYLKQDFLWHCPHVLGCHLNLAGSGCAHSRTQSHALSELQASASVWPPQLPAPDCSGCPRSPLLWVSLYLTSLHILQHSIIFYCVFLSIDKGRLGGREYSNYSLFPPCQKPARVTIQSRFRIDSEQMCLFSKTSNLGETPGLWLLTPLISTKTSVSG